MRAAITRRVGDGFIFERVDAIVPGRPYSDRLRNVKTVRVVMTAKYSKAQKAHSIMGPIEIKLVALGSRISVLNTHVRLGSKTWIAFNDWLRIGMPAKSSVARSRKYSLICPAINIANPMKPATASGNHRLKNVISAMRMANLMGISNIAWRILGILSRVWP